MNAAKVVAPLLSKLPNSLLGALSSTAAGTDVQASNIVGYSESLYIAGAEINKMYWFGPLPGVAMMVVLISEAGTCYVGVHYDTASVTDTDLFARCLREGFDEVLAVAPASTRT
jgi:diacylglycerol O-acyltransferase